MKEGNSSPTIESPKGVRKSELQKKPSSRWNEEAGYLAESPRSTKKKVLHDESSKRSPFLFLIGPIFKFLATVMHVAFRLIVLFYI